MPSFRIETLTDADTGMLYVEAFHEPGDEPVIRSQPMYKTEKDAEAEILGMFKTAWPDRYPFAVDPSIGV
jgi:hypothetical protein